MVFNKDLKIKIVKMITRAGEGYIQAPCYGSYEDLCDRAGLNIFNITQRALKLLK